MSDASGAELGVPVDPVPMFEYFDRQRAREEEEYREVAASATYTELLKHAFAAYDFVLQFEVGQLVQWKPLMRNRRHPLDSTPAIVVGYVREPQTHDRDGDLLAEPNDMIIGVVDGERIFRVSAVASRRFAAWDEEQFASQEDLGLDDSL